MSFKESTYQQLSLTDSFSVLTPREQKASEKSWAKVFADEIFPAIDENRFSVLYSDKASGPNTPFEEQPLSDKTLSCFRKRCYDYETLYNEALYHDCVKDLSASIAELKGISGKVRRMDSMMIESNIRKLLTDADKLLAVCESEYQDSTEYDLFVRCLSEQTIVENETRRLRTYEQNIHSDSLFIREHLERMDVQEEKTVMVADGAYSGFDVLQGINPGAVLL